MSGVYEEVWDSFLEAYQQLKDENNLLREKIKEINGQSSSNSKLRNESKSGE